MIMSTVFGFILTIVGVNESAVAGYKIMTTANNIHEKEWKGSLHEEAHQILKDAIREAGK